MPHTIVLGDSPVGGLGNVGEMESRSWYDHVSDQQEDVLRDPVSNLLKMLSNANESDVYNPEDRVEFDFKPLWQLKDLDRAKMELDVAKKDDIYLKGNVLSSDEVRNSRFAKTHYSQETYIAGESVNNELEGNQSDNV
jgi:phage-related protein (TIGR01555 family)